MYIPGPNGGACSTCPAGKFKAASGPAACTDCPSGSYSSSSAAVSAGTCVACPTHSASPPGVCGTLSHHIITSHVSVRLRIPVWDTLSHRCETHYHTGVRHIITSSHRMPHHHFTHAFVFMCVCARARTRVPARMSMWFTHRKTHICKCTWTCMHTHNWSHTHAHGHTWVVLYRHLFLFASETLRKHNRTKTNLGAFPLFPSFMMWTSLLDKYRHWRS